MPNARSRRSRLGVAAAVLALSAVGAVAPAATASATPGAVAAPAAVEGPLLSYVVNTKANSSSTREAAEWVEAFGGTVVETYRKIGVVVARSTDPGFAANLRSLGPKVVDSVGATRTTAVVQSEDETTLIDTPVATGAQSAADPLEAQQWDLPLIKADQAQVLEDGSRKVLVGILDSGVEDTHPDLAPNVDAASSAGCITGKADTTRASWLPTTSDHGTHVAGTVAAARNGIGMVGVAPGVRIASVKVVSDEGFIYPESAICGFMWAAEHKMDVTNNSYYIDPWLFWCANDPDQAAAAEAVRRAVAYSHKQDVLNVAAAGNQNYDLANKTTDTTSPNDSGPVTRPVSDDCLHLPAEAGGVVSVASVTQAKAKSSFSNYGLGHIDVAAPGSSVLSTVLNGRYGLKSGTSMASPHVAGVAALYKSAHPRAGQAEVLAALRAQADPLACPTTGAAAAQCTGTTAYNSLFGYGLVDALDAVS
ncbi:S8 family peptidase [Motilibacter aurantiacus]|uniref:S8 family peptidase n=1 Tax=Motilibacter aurantiacus TaxID=2714955 RepID=UPI00140D965A|nr:S8 family serine peptidase [Motilibacter aurantiacus]NHC45755.1 S8 family serine peptidase [Motilibacter aurantiacus]